MKVAANIKYLKISAQKLRLGADLVRGSRAVEAQELLLATPNKPARLIYDGLKSAIANAENNYQLNAATLVIDEIKVGQGPALKRIRPRARGSAARVQHPMAHLHIVLEGEAPKKSDAKAETAAKPAKKAAKPVVKTNITTKKRGRR